MVAGLPNNAEEASSVPKLTVLGLSASWGAKQTLASSPLLSPAALVPALALRTSMRLRPLAPSLQWRHTETSETARAMRLYSGGTQRPHEHTKKSNFGFPNAPSRPRHDTPDGDGTRELRLDADRGTSRASGWRCGVRGRGRRRGGAWCGDGAEEADSQREEAPEEAL